MPHLLGPEPSLLDLAYVAIVWVTPTLYQELVSAPRLKAPVDDDREARVRSYRRSIALRLLLFLPVCAAWILGGRSWAGLALVVWPAGWRRWTQMLAIIAILALGAVQLRGIARIAASPQKRGAYRETFGGMEFLLPRRATEYRWFTALSLTGGFCEEFLWRGYLVWVLTARIESLLSQRS